MIWHKKNNLLQLRDDQSITGGYFEILTENGADQNIGGR